MNWVKVHWQALLHGIVALALVCVALLSPILGIGMLNHAGWFFREQAQAAPEHWWKPWLWSLDKHIEWLIPSGLGYLVCLGWYIAH